MSPVTPEAFEEWKHHPVTKQLLKKLLTDRETMKEGLVYDSYENPENVKGRCQATAILLNLEYEDIYND